MIIFRYITFDCDCDCAMPFSKVRTNEINSSFKQTSHIKNFVVVGNGCYAMAKYRREKRINLNGKFRIRIFFEDFSKIN